MARWLKNPRGREIGTATVTLEPAAATDPWLAGVSDRFLASVSHVDTVARLPAGARRLGTTALDGNAIFALGESIRGVQFHPEFDADVTAGYVRARTEAIAAEGLDAAEIAGNVRETPESRALVARFIRTFVLPAGISGSGTPLEPGGAAPLAPRRGGKTPAITLPLAIYIRYRSRGCRSGAAFSAPHRTAPLGRRRSRMTSLAIGMDVGSTTVKAVVMDPTTKKILWSDYQRHHTKQPEYVLSMLQTIVAAFPRDTAFRMFLTGSGAGPLCAPTGGKFVQEVNAVTLAVEHLHPDVGSVIELGGQDAKIIMFKQDADGDGKTATASMNDKCASAPAPPSTSASSR